MCEIASNYTKGCDAPAGVEMIYAFPVVDATGVSTISSFTHTAGEVTDLVLTTGKQANTFSVEQETATFNVTSVGEKTNGADAYTHTSTVIFHGNSADDIVRVDALNKGRHAFIHRLSDETYELLHMENGAKGSSDRAAGTLYEDLNGTTMTMTSKEKIPALKISESIVTSLLTPAP